MRHCLYGLAVAVLVLCVMADTAFAATLGVKLGKIGAEEAKKLALEPGLGLKVLEVKEGSPADKAGIRKGMIIVSMDGKDIKSENDLVAAIDKAGRKMKITVVTEDGWEEDKVVVFQEDEARRKIPEPVEEETGKPSEATEDRPDEGGDELTYEELAEIERELQQMRKRIGQLLEQLRSKRSAKRGEPGQARTPPVKKSEPSKLPGSEEEKPEPKKRQTGQPFMGAELESAPEGEKGVEILRVLEDYAADKAGLKQYDIILKVNGEPVNTVPELRKHIAEAGVSGRLKMVVDRYGKIIEVELTLGARPQETQ